VIFDTETNTYSSVKLPDEFNYCKEVDGCAYHQIFSPDNKAVALSVIRVLRYKYPYNYYSNPAGDVWIYYLDKKDAPK
jgi:hypothetical protein